MPLPDQAPPSWHALHYLPLDAQAILDIGCGAGEALHRAYELGIPELFGIDINPTAIALARQRLHEVKNAHLLQGSADQIPVGDESVDVTICCEVLEHVPQELRPSVIR